MAAKAPCVVFVSYRAANPEGDGGNHRAYQMLQDLQQAFGRGNVHCVTLEDWVTDDQWRPPRTRRSRMERLRHRVLRMAENPYRLITREGWSHHAVFGTRGVLSPEFIDYFLEHIPAVGTYDVCLVDHPMFDQIRHMNALAGIPTAIATHNIESLDPGRMRIDSLLAAQRAGVDFANEMRALSLYRERLTISKSEASLLTGLGMTGQFYPYVPTGQIRDNMARISETRRRSEPEPDLFLLMGTATHAPTRNSLTWFLDHARERGIPRGARVALVGSKVDQLLPPNEHLAGLEVLGRVSDEELFDLFTRVRAALVPHRMGFGALTRIPELACAGVPMLVFPHAAYAIDPPPGLHMLKGDSWEYLVHGIRQLMQPGTCATVDADAYFAWERNQCRPLGPTLASIVGAGCSRPLEGACSR